jgi:redox-sensitive bicupin YhaK (pirin superfamily)
LPRRFTQSITFSAGQSAAVPEDVEELAVYAVDSKLKVDDEILPPRHLALLTAGSHHIHAESHTRAVFIGGQSLGKRYMWWNFVSSKKERIQKAMDDWKQKRFGAVYQDNGTPTSLPESDSYSLMSD